MSSRSSISISKALLVLLLCAGIAHAGGRKRIVVLDFEGPKADKFHDDLVKLIKKQHTVVATDKWNGAAEELDAGKITEKNVKKVAKKLKIDGIVQGKVEKRRDEYIIQIKLRAGTTGEMVGQRVDTKSDAARLDSKAQRDIKDELLAAIDDLEANHGGGGGDDEADDDKPAKKKATAKADKNDDDDGDAKPAKKDKKVAKSDDDDSDDAAPAKKRPFSKKFDKGGDKSADRSDDDDGDAKPAKKDKKVAKTDDDDAKPAKKEKEPKESKKEKESKKAKTDDDTEAALSTKKSDDSDSDDDGSKKKKVAKKDDDDSGGDTSAEADADNGPTDLDAALSVGQRAIDATAGLSFTARRLNFDYSSALAGSQIPPHYTQSIPVAGALFDVTVYPMAYGHKREGAITGLGIELSYDKVLKINSQKAYGPVGMQKIADLATSESAFQLAGVFRYPFGKAANAPVVGGKLSYQTQSFTIAQTTPDNMSTDIPNTEYSMYGVTVFGRYPLAPKMVAGVDLGLLLVSTAGTATGDMGNMAYYGPTSLSGYHAEGNFEYMLTKKVFARGVLRYESISMTFSNDPNKAGMQVFNRDTDATTQDVTGAKDTYFGVDAVIGFLF